MTAEVLQLICSARSFSLVVLTHRKMEPRATDCLLILPWQICCHTALFIRPRFSLQVHLKLDFKKGEEKKSEIIHKLIYLALFQSLKQYAEKAHVCFSHLPYLSCMLRTSFALQISPPKLGCLS